jgi:hypothetical protein
VPVVHLWHKENDRSQLLQNQQRLDAAIAATHIRAALGVDQYTQTSKTTQNAKQRNI